MSNQNDTKGGLIQRLMSVFRGTPNESRPTDEGRAPQAQAPQTQAPQAAMTAQPVDDLTIRPEPTPNPNSTKFTVNRRLLDGPGRDFPNADAAEASPLATKLFANQEVSGVYVGAGFVTVTAREETNWFDLFDVITNTIKAHIASGEPAVVGEDTSAGAQPKSDNEVEAGIIRILDEEIRPAVAMDGGDITFGGYADGVVRLHLRGSCQGCPSSTATLKHGIETRLQEEYPEIISVEAM